MVKRNKPARAKAARKVSVDARHLADLEEKVAALTAAAAAESLKAAENQRVRMALDKAGANLMVADEQLNIVYLNEAAQQLFRELQHDLRRDLPHFDADKLVGTNIDVFHRNPAHQRQRLAELRATLSSDLHVGGHTIRIIANPMLDADGKRVGTVVEWFDRTQQVRHEQQALANARVRGALDKAGANVTLADDKLEIVYVNESARQLFRDLQNDLRRELPHFDADKLVGTNIDVFHRNPAHQRGLLENLQTTHTAQFRAGGRVVKIAATPVSDADGKRVGTIVEWWDRTQEVRVEEEVAGIVKGALENDLSARVPLEGKSGFIANLATGLNQLLDNTAQMVREIKSAAAAVRMGAEEIGKGNANLSQRTEEQSSSLEETASSMEQMTSTVKQNADNAGQANQLASAARDQAEKGGVVVGKAVRAMTEINEASKKIADIIGVIDEIAFQTNLLALNAAVEAARAGEQGRGFAVVATEVRSLAGRSATAAKEIKGLIQDSVRKVEDGSSLVTQSGQTLEQIVSSVKKVSDIIAEIAAASREQSSGIEQVNKAVMQMDEMTQQNAALVEEATAASQAMAEGAGELNRMMERFTLPAAKAPAASASAAAAPPAAVAAPQPERRGPNRPWSGNGKAPGGEAAVPKARAAAGEWQDF